MICYRDTTFCPFWGDCDKGVGCESAYTPSVLQEAMSWWGSENPPVAILLEKPKCFVRKLDEDLKKVKCARCGQRPLTIVKQEEHTVAFGTKYLRTLFQCPKCNQFGYNVKILEEGYNADYDD